ISDSRRGLELDPRAARAYTNRGNALRASGDLAEAMNDYNQALAIDPREALALLNRGLGYLQQGREAEARQDFDQCLRIDPTLQPQLEAIIKKASRQMNR